MGLVFASVDLELPVAYLLKVTGLFRLAVQVEGVYLPRLARSRVRFCFVESTLLLNKQSCSRLSPQGHAELEKLFHTNKVLY